MIDNIFSKIKNPTIIAGLNPPTHLIDAVKKHPHIILKQNCSEQEMQTLIEDAQTHCLYTDQATGLKLKLLNVLYSGRFVITNSAMLAGTQLTEACYIANLPEEYIQEINILFSKEFTAVEKEKRKKMISSMDNKEKTKTLLGLI